MVYKLRSKRVNIWGIKYWVIDKGREIYVLRWNVEIVRRLKSLRFVCKNLKFRLLFFI